MKTSILQVGNVATNKHIVHTAYTLHAMHIRSRGCFLVYVRICTFVIESLASNLLTAFM